MAFQWRKMALHCKYSRYRHKTMTTVFSSPTAVKQAKFRLTSIIIVEIPSFVYVIYFPTDAHGQHAVQVSGRNGCANLAILMSHGMVNKMVLVLWRYLPDLQLGVIFFNGTI